MEIRKVGVVGCGLMGSGIVEVCARAGYEVVVREVNDEFLQKGLGRIKKSMSKGVRKGKLAQEDMDAAWGRIKGTTTLADMADCDIAIEAAVENMEIKKSIFAELDGILPPHAILASNTSSSSCAPSSPATRRWPSPASSVPPWARRWSLLRTHRVSSSTAC